MNILDDLKLQYKTGGMVQKLIFWNIGLFVGFSLLEVVLKLSNVAFSYFDFVVLPSNTTEFLAKPWTLITFNFFHATIFHLIFNLLHSFISPLNSRDCLINRLNFNLSLFPKSIDHELKHMENHKQNHQCVIDKVLKQ